MAPPTSSPASSAPLIEQIASFDRVFWLTNIMEVLERLAYFGVRTVLPTYMVLSIAEGGPGFTHVQKGWIYFWWAMLQSLLPMFTGGFADRYGYKRTIVVAILLKMAGYVVMAHAVDAAILGPAPVTGASSITLWVFFVGSMLLASGTAVFKPGVQGILATNIPKENASVGWGIFYQLVNIGGFFGPILSGYLRILDWRYVFYSCTAIVALNFLMLVTFDEPANKNPVRDERAPLQVLTESIVGLFKPRLITFILLFSGFWFMFNQIFDILPNFLDDWVDSKVLWEIWVNSSLPGADFAAEQLADGKNFNQEWIINLNPGLIILFMLPIAWLTNLTTPLRSILIGIAIASAGTLFIGSSTSIWLCIAAILVFSVGEMASSPKKMEYLASLARPGEQGLYMGYANVPLAIGWGAGSLFGGWFYENFGDRTNLARRWLMDNRGLTPEAVASIDKPDVLPRLMSETNLTALEATQMLWDLYNPGQMWLIFAGIGIFSLCGLAIYDLVLRGLDRDLPPASGAADLT